MSAGGLHKPTGNAALGASFAAATMLLWAALPFVLARARSRASRSSRGSRCAASCRRCTGSTAAAGGCSPSQCSGSR
jgi:hypothetical protein